MRFVRPLTTLDDLIGGLAAQTRTEMLIDRPNGFEREPLHCRLQRASANALAQEIARPNSILPNFIACNTDFAGRDQRSAHENFWAIHLTEGALRNRLPVEQTFNWPRAIGYAQEVVIDAVMAELREQGLI